MKGGATPLTTLTGYAVLHELIFNRNATVTLLSTESSYGIIYRISVSPENALHTEFDQPLTDYVMKIVLVSRYEDYVDTYLVYTDDLDSNGNKKEKQVMNVADFTQEIVTQNEIWRKTSSKRNSENYGNPVCPSVIDEAFDIFPENFYAMFAGKFPELAPSFTYILEQAEAKEAVPVFCLMNLIRGRPLHIVHHLPVNEMSFYNLSVLYKRLFIKAVRLCLECSIIHTDLHSNNVLVDEQLNPFIIDFGRVYRIPVGENVYTRLFEKARNQPSYHNIRTFINNMTYQLIGAGGEEFHYILEHLVAEFDDEGNLKDDSDDDLSQDEISDYHMDIIWDLLLREIGNTPLMHGGKKQTRKRKSKRRQQRA